MGFRMRNLGIFQLRHEKRILHVVVGKPFAIRQINRHADVSSVIGTPDKLNRVYNAAFERKHGDSNENNDNQKGICRPFGFRYEHHGPRPSFKPIARRCTRRQPALIL